MAHEQWRERLEETQAEYVPLVTICVLAVVILTSIRDLIVIDEIPDSLTIANLAAVAILLLLASWTFWKKIPAGQSNLIALIAVATFTLKALANIYLEQDPLPLVWAILIFATSLCFLSHKFLLATGLAIGLAWAAVAFISLSLAQIVPTLLVMVVAFAFALLVLERRIQSLERLYALEKKVATLERILPMCANCKKTRDENDNWVSIESYLEEQEGKQVTHGVCPQCSKELYGDYLDKRGKTGSQVEPGRA